MRRLLPIRRSVVLVVCSGLTLCAVSSCGSDAPASASPDEAGAAGQSDASGGAAELAGAGGTSAGGTTVGGTAGFSEAGAAGGPIGSAGDAGAAGAAGTAGAAGAASTPLEPIAEADLPATLASRYCASVAHCCTQGVANCVAAETTEISGLLQQAKTKGQVYDADRAAQCASAVLALGEGADCSTSFMSTQLSLGPCLAVLDGTTEPGATCTTVVDCRHGAAATTGGYAGCAPLGGQGPARCQDTVPVRRAGDACTELPGGPHSSTDGVVYVCMGGLTCTAATCVALPKTGELCPGGECADGTCTSGKCVAYAQRGESCASLTCEAGLECEGNICTHPPNEPWILDLGFWSTTYACPQ